jgi:integrase
VGVKIKKRGGKWYVFVTYHGRRKAKCVGSSRQVAEHIKRQLEAKLALGDLGFLTQSSGLTFEEHAQRWLKQHAAVQLKKSTAEFYAQYLRLYVLPRFGKVQLTAIERHQVKDFLAGLSATSDLARNTLRLILSTLRVILNHAVEDGLIDRNPAEKLGRFTKTDRPEHQAQAMTRQEAETLLAAAVQISPDYHPFFLMALRAVLRMGELIAVTWGDIQFGTSEDDPNRYILVQRNFLRGEFTTPKSKKSRRVDLSRELRRTLLELRDKRMLEAMMAGRGSIANDLVFPSKAGTVVDPSNLFHYHFLPCLEHAGLRRFRFHDLRHAFGSLLIQDCASLAYVRDQMGHSSIQITGDTYGHLIPGANINWVDGLARKTTSQQTATQAQLTRGETNMPDRPSPELIEHIEDFGGPTRIRTWNQQIMSLLL